MIVTPRPWAIDDLVHLKTSDDRDFALLAVNNFDQLVETLELLSQQAVERGSLTIMPGNGPMFVIQNALIRARGEPA